MMGSHGVPAGDRPSSSAPRPWGLWLAGLAVSALVVAWGWQHLRESAIGELAGESRPNQVPSDTPSELLAARSRASQGRGASAIVNAYAQIRVADLRADDLYLIGAGLTDEGHSRLRLAAFETAVAREPGHARSLAALARLSAQTNRSATDLEWTDRLAAIPAWQARAALILGLLRLEVENAKLAELVGFRIGQRDRAAVTSLRTPRAAERLLARTILECGEPETARRLLDEQTSAPRPEPEAMWLLSRAFLQRGELDAARKALEQSQGFGRDQPLALEPAPFVGSAQCSECHSSITSSQQASRHARTIRTGEALSQAQLPDGPLPDPIEPSVVHEMRHIQGAVEITTRTSGDQAFRALARYLLGSGRHGTTLVGQDDAGVFRELRISEYAEPPKWDLTGGFPPTPSKPEEYLGRALNADSLIACVHCHTTDGKLYLERTGPQAQDQGIGCERCHGPGANHVKAISLDFPELAIARPKISGAERRLNLCGQCHQSSGQTSPVDPGFTRFQATTLSQSRCYRESRDRFDCTTCHDPHRDAETSAAHYEKKCQTCHGQATAALAGVHLSNPESDRSVKALACGLNRTSGCIECHMPRVRDDSAHTFYTDHLIRVHREPASNGGPESANSTSGP